MRGGVTVNLSIDQMTREELVTIGVQAISKSLHVDLVAAGYAGVQKIEGLALLDSGRLAVVNDNDFGVAQIVVDQATGTFTRAPTYNPEQITLGLISVTGLDRRIATNRSISATGRCSACTSPMPSAPTTSAAGHTWSRQTKVMPANGRGWSKKPA